MQNVAGFPLIQQILKIAGDFRFYIMIIVDNKRKCRLELIGFLLTLNNALHVRHRLESCSNPYISRPIPPMHIQSHFGNMLDHLK